MQNFLLTVFEPIFLAAAIFVGTDDSDSFLRLTVVLIIAVIIGAIYGYVTGESPKIKEDKKDKKDEGLVHSTINMRQFSAVLEYIDKMWIASCEELRITLEGSSYDALIERIKIAIREIAEVELGHKGDIKIVFSMRDRIEEIRAAS